LMLSKKDDTGAMQSRAGLARYVAGRVGEGREGRSIHREGFRVW
jgi:hypothetical protein